MAFTLVSWSQVTSSQNTDSLRVFGYKSSTDTLSTIQASAYFNTVARRLNTGDMIIIQGSDGRSLLEVTATSPNVTV